MKKLLLFFSITTFYFSDVSAQCVKKITAGTYHSSAILGDNSLLVWGDVFGWVDPVTNEPLNPIVEPQQFGTDKDWKDISGGKFFTIALKNDGSLWGWGYNTLGQLGDPTIPGITYLPVRIGEDNDWMVISAGVNHVVALKTDGSLWSWGHNNQLQAGKENVEKVLTPQRVGSDNDWIEIDGGLENSLAIKADGTLWRWGINNGEADFFSESAIPVQIGTDNDWAKVSAGYAHILAIKKDSSLWGWGYNPTGQLAMPSDPLTSSRVKGPIKISPKSNWTAISAGTGNSVAIASDNTVWTCGTNWGPYFPMTRVSETVPERLYEWTQRGTANDWNNISTGSDHAVALNNKGEIAAWGYNVFNQVSPGYYYIIDPYFVPVNCPVITGANPIEFKGAEVSTYPNPFNDLIHLKSVEGIEINKAELINSQGQARTIEIENSSLRTSDLSIGIYILKLTDSEGNSYVTKIIKD